MSDGKTTTLRDATATSQTVAHATTPDGDDSPGTIEPGRGYRSFAQIPEALLLDQRVPHGAVRAWGLLDRQARGRAVALDSLNRLAAKLGCSPDTARRFLAALVNTDWLDIQHVPGRTSRYLLNYEQPPPDVHPNGGPGKSARGGRDAMTPPATVQGHTRAVPSLREEVKGEAKPPPPPPPSTTRTPTYVGRCPAHGDHPNPPSCGPCGDARRAHHAAVAVATATQPDLVKCRTHSLDHAPNAECRSCRADRLAGDDRPALARAG